jgi:hypothetical protein
MSPSILADSVYFFTARITFSATRRRSRCVSTHSNTFANVPMPASRTTS